MWLAGVRMEPQVLLGPKSAALCAQPFINFPRCNDHVHLRVFFFANIYEDRLTRAVCQVGVERGVQEVEVAVPSLSLEVDDLGPPEG